MYGFKFINKCTRFFTQPKTGSITLYLLALSVLLHVFRIRYLPVKLRSNPASKNDNGTIEDENISFLTSKNNASLLMLNVEKGREDFVEAGGDDSRDPLNRTLDPSDYNSSGANNPHANLSHVVALTTTLTTNYLPQDVPANSEIVKATLKELNDLGVMSFELSMPRISSLLDNDEKNKTLFQQILSSVEAIDLATVNEFLRKRAEQNNDLETVTLAILVCGERRAQAMVMLKSALMFSLDVNLHLVVFSDDKTMLNIGQDILSLKLGLNKVGHHGFTYEIHLEWYPEDGPDWKSMYRMCATQRLFFPSLLAHHDAVIYLDTDILVLSSMKEFWNMFKTQMGTSKMLGITPNSEGFSVYNPESPLPYYGEHGMNGGVMLMNLTQLREFEFELRAESVYNVYKERIWLADQDIINAILHGFSDRVVNMECNHNFYWIHCGDDKCEPALKSGVYIMHGNNNAFQDKDENQPFFFNSYEAFRELNLFSDSYSDLLNPLKQKFAETETSNCSPLTAELLYGRAEDYLRSFKSSTLPKSESGGKTEISNESKIEDMSKDEPEKAPEREIETQTQNEPEKNIKFEPENGSKQKIVPDIKSDQDIGTNQKMETNQEVVTNPENAPEKEIKPKQEIETHKEIETNQVMETKPEQQIGTVHETGGQENGPEQHTHNVKQPENKPEKQPETNLNPT